MRAAGARAPKASPRERGPDRHGRARGISFGGAVLPRGRPATQGQDGSPPIALARGPAARTPFLRCLVTKPRKASGTRPEQPAQELQLALVAGEVVVGQRSRVGDAELAPRTLGAGGRAEPPDE